VRDAAKRGDGWVLILLAEGDVGCMIRDLLLGEGNLAVVLSPFISSVELAKMDVVSTIISTPSRARS
jgi:hypothetical protein